MSSSDGDYGKLTSPCQIVKADSGRHWLEEDLVVRETPLTVFVNSREIATLVCSPVDQVYLAVGFLCSEGVLKKREDIESVELDAERGLVRIKTAPLPGIEEKMFLKRHITPSAGRSNIRVHFAAEAGLPPPVTSQLQIKAATATRLAAELQERAHLFRRTGGVHNAALVQGEEILIFQEDIGRHNTIDKIHGRCFLEGIPRSDKMVVFSGRVSSEIVLKVARMRVPVLISRSAPTDLALKLAEELQITLLGFVRENRLSVYAHGERVLF